MPTPDTADQQAQQVVAPSKSDYEARFIESLKRLNAPKWLSESAASNSPDSPHQHTGTKHKYDKLKQRFRSAAKKPAPDDNDLHRTRHKSEDGRRSLGLVDIDLDEPPNIERSLNASKSAYSLDKSSTSLSGYIAASKSNDLLTAYTRSSHERYLEELTGRGMMKRSKSSYSTYSSQVRAKYNSDKSGPSGVNSSKSTSNLVRPQSGCSSKWYRPKPLQLPESLAKQKDDFQGKRCAMENFVDCFVNASNNTMNNNDIREREAKQRRKKQIEILDFF